MLGRGGRWATRLVFVIYDAKGFDSAPIVEAGYLCGELMAASRSFNIHGDNIVECIRVFEYIVSALGKIVKSIDGPKVSITCPVYVILTSDAEMTFQFFPGYGERRWNQDILGFVKRTGGRLREAADAIITVVRDKDERPIAAIEFCGALPAGNQAWQRQGRAFSFAHAGIPYFFVTELGGYELTASRDRKAERLPNPAIPFSFFAITHYQGAVCLPVYEANSGARVETVELYGPIYGKAEFLEFLQLALLDEPTGPAAQALGDKCLALVELLAGAKRKQDGLTASQWREARVAITEGGKLTDYLSSSARLPWSKTTSIELTPTARLFMALGAAGSLGLTSSSLPLSFVPREGRPDFARKTKGIYGDLQPEFERWLASGEQDLAIAWVNGFKPRGDDARPDRGLPPLARMLVGDQTELMTFVYGPAPAPHWAALARNPALLARTNGLWEAVMAVSDGLLVDGTTKPAGTPRGYAKACWAEVLKTEVVPLSVTPVVRSLGEQDVDSALHIVFEALGQEVIFGGMCNPPGGDWSGISFRWTKEGPEHRWLTLPRVSGKGAKRPDHVFSLFGHGQHPICLCIESKERAGSLEPDIGPSLISYAEALFDQTPSIYRNDSLAPWSIFDASWEARPSKFISAGAYLSDPDDPFRGLPGKSGLDVQMGVSFLESGRKCRLFLRGDTEAGDVLVKYLVNIDRWSHFASVIDVNN